MFSKTLSFVVLFLLIDLSFERKNCFLKEIDFCFVKDFSTQQLFKLPETRDHFDRWCAQTQTLRECLEKYSKNCFSKFQQEMVKWMSDPLIRGLRSRCIDDRELYEDLVIGHAHCINEQPMSGCFSELRRSLEFGETSGDNICCHLSESEKCFEKFEKKCGKKEILKKWFSFEEIKEIVCSKSFDKEKCKSFEAKKPKSRDSKTALSRTLDALLGEIKE